MSRKKVCHATFSSAQVITFRLPSFGRSFVLIYYICVVSSAESSNTVNISRRCDDMKMCISKKLGKSALSVHPFLPLSIHIHIHIRTQYKPIMYEYFFLHNLILPHFKILYTRLHTYTHTNTEFPRTNRREKRRRRKKKNSGLGAQRIERKESTLNPWTWKNYHYAEH